MATYATLNAVNLPIQFRYRPYIPSKRMATIATVGAVVVQAASPQIVHGDGVIAWTIEAATPPEFQVLWDLYNTAAPTLYTFVGYWGENYQVYFTVLDPPSVESRLFNLSGMFQVICETSDYNAEC